MAGTVAAVQFLASEIAAAVGGTLVGPDVEVAGAAIDSRLVQAGQLFVAVIAERDGHDFIEASAASGAVAALTSRPVEARLSSIVVPDTVAALSRLGALARQRLTGPVVGITGSVGKTSTKDLAATVLGERHVVAASEKSFNNELGVPLTLVNAPADTEVAVVEMGSRGIGHVAWLCEMAQPTIAVVTAVDIVHTESMGDLDTVARAKGELVESLPSSGIAVLNGDDERVAAMAGRTTAWAVRYGFEAGDVRAVDVELGPDLRARFRLESAWGSAEVHLGVRGLHQVGNALAAAAVALVCEMPVDEVAAGLELGALSPWRMDLQTSPSGTRVLNDAYNAGPTSMEAALRALAHLDAARHHAVLGPMAELGEHGPVAHRRIAALAGELGVQLVVVGTDEYGVEPVAGVDAALVALGELGSDDAVLVKGSRVAGLERVADKLLG
ncbi:MAG TPA: UDP-N-acetylmuramoyl-tripeptide--D-alanyl-D-alanine ligase [Acidimicrobiales bacterium]